MDGFAEGFERAKYRRKGKCNLLEAKLLLLLLSFKALLSPSKLEQFNNPKRGE